jgi:type II secretory ATPase GspE/PulE/Tfp pilus assembly ATPase PilB-like protein
VASLNDLGYSEEQVRLIQGSLARPHGIILCAGPTGSGKSTTLAAMVSMLSTEEKSITIEDPPEYDLTNATQVPADTHNEDKSFAAMVRASMRMDPDNIMIGEIRDEDTARMAVRAAITGHRVFSTVHAKSALSIVTRLVDLEISPTLLADPDLLVALLYQRLVPSVCQKCAPYMKQNHAKFKEKYEGLYQRLMIVVQNDVSQLDGIRFRAKNGCKQCNGSGVDGRTVVAEVIYLDHTGRALIEKGKIAEWEDHLLASGWQPMVRHLMEKIKAGIVSPIDAEKVVGSLAESSIGKSFMYGKASMKLGG